VCEAEKRDGYGKQRKEGLLLVLMQGQKQSQRENLNSQEGRRI
jgi:hypothetical protein